MREVRGAMRTDDGDVNRAVDGKVPVAGLMGVTGVSKRLLRLRLV